MVNVRALPVLLLAIAFLAPLPGCLQAQETAFRQWQHSPHALSLDTPDERERMNRPGCARCHTAQGYQEVILGKRESTAPYPDVIGLTCEACHEAAESGEGFGPLRAGNPRDACRGCHDELVANSADYLSWCSQWGIFDGTGGAESPGGRFEVATHSGVEGGCVACHMAPASPDADPLLVGGHTFRVKTKGDLPPAFNSGPCEPCHGEMTLQQLASSQEQVRGLLAELAQLLPQKPDPADPGSMEPRYPADPSLDAIQARASHNYWLVQKDGSFGVHNPLYSRGLLEQSIAELRSRGRARLPGLESQTGTQIRWSHVDFVDHGFGQFLPFALNWLDSPHPSTTSPKGAVIEGITVEHPQAEALRRIYLGLGIPAEVVSAAEPRIIVHMSSPAGPFEITSGESLLAYYAARSSKNIR